MFRVEAPVRDDLLTSENTECKTVRRPRGGGIDRRPVKLGRWGGDGGMLRCRVRGERCNIRKCELRYVVVDDKNIIAQLFYIGEGLAGEVGSG